MVRSDTLKRKRGMIMKRILTAVLAISFVFSLAACGAKPPAEPPGDEPAEASSQENGPMLGAGAPKLLSVSLTLSFDDSAVSQDEKFGAALLNMSQEEFEALGFCLGDSLSVEFQNGYSLSDVPYFNGYYVRNGEPVVVAYPGDPYIRITRNNLGIWDEAGLKDGDTVTIQLEETGKYLAIQEALGQVYSFDRDDYSSDEAFSNFRTLSGGGLKKDFLYRGASPVDNSRGRAAYVDGLLEKNGIGFVIDLADSEEDMEGYIHSPGFSSGYAKALYDAGAVVLLDMGSAYTSDAYKEKTARGLRAALDADGPIYIHCMEGKDRTGFVCLLLEALAGAGYDEMMADYMTTYENYFHVTQAETPEKYDAIVDLYFVPFLEYLHGTEDVSALKTADFREDAAAYLKDGGMTDEELADLLSLITQG